MTEQQKQIIFLSNCMYQLESQKQKIENNEPIASLPELSIYAMFEKNKLGYIDWEEQYSSIKNQLINIGLSENWIEQLKIQLNKYLQMGNSVEDFRMTYMSAIDMLLNMVLGVISNANPEIPKSVMAESIVGDIYTKNYWEGPVIQQINQVRKLNTELGFDLEFVQELIIRIVER